MCRSEGQAWPCLTGRRGRLPSYGCLAWDRRLPRPCGTGGCGCMGPALSREGGKS